MRRARDAVASIRRWLPRDTHGQILLQRLDDISALDDRRFQLRLTRPFGPLLDALAKPWSYPCFIYPERFVAIDPATPLTEVGSGPYRFVAAERVSGAQVVYRKFDGYIPTSSGIPSLTAGPKIAGFERQEWKVITDTSTSAAALKNGEVDWWEAVAPDLRHCWPTRPACCSISRIRTAAMRACGSTTCSRHSTTRRPCAPS